MADRDVMAGDRPNQKPLSAGFAVPGTILGLCQDVGFGDGPPCQGQRRGRGGLDSPFLSKFISFSSLAAFRLVYSLVWNVEHSTAVLAAKSGKQAGKMPCYFDD